MDLRKKIPLKIPTKQTLRKVMLPLLGRGGNVMI